MTAKACKIKLNIPRKHAERKLAGVLGGYYQFLHVKKNAMQRLDDAHHLLLDISEDELICFRGEY